MRLILVWAFALIPLGLLPAQQDDAPPIVINSPDTATTFAYGTIKSHSLVWNGQMLVARITFTDQEQTMSTPTDDTHEFRLPGITFDAAKHLFYAKSGKGELIPIAHFKKTLFIKSIETLPNAQVRVIHPHGEVSVVLEAISPNDPAMHPAPSNPDSDGTHKVDTGSLLN